MVRQKTEHVGATSEGWIGNFNVKAWKTTVHKLHKTWRPVKFCKILEDEHNLVKIYTKIYSNL